MYSQQITHLILAATLLALPINSYKLHFYSGTNCTGAAIGEPHVFGPDAGCQTVYSGNAIGIVIESTGPIDDPFYLVKYSSTDCKPDTEVIRGDHGCLTKNYGSFRVGSIYDKPWNSTTVSIADGFGSTESLKNTTLKPEGLKGGANELRTNSLVVVAGLISAYMVFQ